MKRPAILDGPPAFPDGLPFARPYTPPLDAVTARLRPSYETGQLTNGRIVRTLEEQAAERLGVEHVVAVSSCTAGLMLVVQALCPEGPVVLPSFTFSASGHAVVWNGNLPIFAECDPRSYQVDLDDVAELVDEARAILATHVFGAPCDPTEVERLGRLYDLPVIFDAAHAFGALHRGRPVGSFGDAEVFSLSPTKPVVAGEGGLVATRHADVAERLRVGRDYGNPGDYDTRFVGLNARMSEFHAAMAVESLALLDDQLRLRTAIAGRYRAGLCDVAGISTQAIPVEDSSTYKDFSLSVDPDAFGMSRDVLKLALTAEGVDTRNYFDPPVHRQQAYAELKPEPRPITDDVSSRVISLPMFARLAPGDADRVVERIAAIQACAEEVSAALMATAATPGT